MLRILFFTFLWCSILFAEVDFQGSVVYQNNEVIFSANIYKDNVICKDMNVFVNEEKIAYHPVLGYISGLPAVKPQDSVSVVVEDLSGNIVYQKSVVLPPVPQFRSPSLVIDSLYSTIYQWNVVSSSMYFTYENNGEQTFEKYFNHYESSVEIPKTELRAGKSNITICAMSCDVQVENPSLFAATITTQEINVRGEEKISSTKREGLSPVKSWKDSFEIPKVGRRTFDLNAYMMPRDGTFTVSGRNRRMKASVVSVFYKEQPIWSWDRVYKFSKKGFSQSFPLKAQEIIVVATHHVRWGVDFK
ncbi:hypothetical protein [Candidatus Uabimicrobium sp. HlEnr_7]|uniref:hypothetical protein n=1 Tax=Candidatus Uabimicrobium helgolandensis TaxID=3095367 RepID=UPI0035589A0D